MKSASTKQVTFEQKERLKCSPSCPRLIYDEPYIFRVRSERPSSRLFPCESCLKAAKQQPASISNNQYQKRCSRLPPAPVDFEYLNHPNTSPSKRTSNICNWDNFMKNKSRYGKYKNFYYLLFLWIYLAINTPYALCNLSDIEHESEKRPPFVNYGGHYNDKQYGQKRTFNSLAVHVCLVE